MGEVPAMVEIHRENRVTVVEGGLVGGGICLRTRMGLDVRVVHPEELLGPRDRDLFDLVDDLAATVVPAPRVALGVLVREHRAHRFEHGVGDEVLRGDQLDGQALALRLPPEKGGDIGIGLVEVRGQACHGVGLRSASQEASASFR